MAQLVTIAHPGIDGEAVITVEAVPGYASRGWLIVDSVTDPTVPAPPVALTKPAKSASVDVWRTYAVAAHVLGLADGLSFDDAMSATRDQLVAHFKPLPDPADEAVVPAPTSQES